MKEINTFIGYWFIPNEVPKKWSGELRITKENRILLDFVLIKEEILIVVPEIFNQIHNINNQDPIPLINGYAKNNNTKTDVYFTLIDLELISYSENGLIAITLEAKFCLNHYQVQKQNHLLFTNLMLKFEGFDHWMNKYGFKVKNENDPKVFSSEISFQPPAPIELLSNKDIIIYFFFRAKSPYSVDGPKAEMEQSVFLNIEFNNPQSLDFLVKQVERFQNLFTFINNYPTRRTYCQTKLKHDKRKAIPNIGDREIDLIYREMVPDFTENISRRSALFTYTDVENQFPDFIQNWIRMYELYEPALDQYFDTLYFNQGHVVSRLVNISSVLEIFYYRKYKKTVKPKDKIYLKDILNTLISELSFINERHYNLTNEFIEELIIIRRYYVHGTEVKTKPIDPINQKKKIFKYIRSLENIFRIHLLIELGLSQEVISKMIERKPWQWGKLNN